MCETTCNTFQDSKVKCILFDFKGTIQDSHHAFYHAAYAVFQYVKDHVKPELVIDDPTDKNSAILVLDEMYKRSKVNYPHNFQARDRYKESFMETYRYLEIPIEDLLIGKTGELFLHKFLNDDYLHRDVREVIPNLRDEGYVLGLNTACDNESGRIIKHNPFISKYFGDRITIAEDVGRWVKDEGSINHTLGLCEAKAEESVMVGDRLTDFPGAKKLGLKTILVQRDVIIAKETDENRPDIKIPTLYELEQTVRQIA